MRIENLDAIVSKEALSLAPAQQIGFADQLLAEANTVNQKMTVAASSLQDLAAGKASNIHHVMLALEDAKLSFQLLTQVRNKLLEGYQEVLRMQI
ncbi:flagellar hook-basal body complex protein FliE [Pseudomethylobacillus aquaticus]|uniref:Flagellar hook-basal body complex protein FliE n=1 Tax=Pseudomethylobacillus aquaticus TaxID=2676064 RepID=A0A3N0V071_9PROT|nr:flagellar hook-basal body complex protein FliE [Pseudomethylobacillus aquaticus]ROH85901.1 flagellar hook-basal body complex protein FliE [Pseudomethylobacillus aquaticus]